MEEKSIQVLRGVLLEANKDHDFGNGPVQFTRQALQGMCDSWNAKQEEKGFIEIALSMEGDKLMVESKVHYLYAGWMNPEIDLEKKFEELAKTPPGTDARDLIKERG